ncbi:uncharacterized protein LOC106645034 [Copidosoma floridanum]|uniref:uncharacterized protein LOC106645034 n=1 Tax=Copidosoma floridanum TaxID=29053 RepID=UPI0006C95E12|nr:uncharacterized protein LOC106645034 [Copidosoma floridanum]
MSSAGVPFLLITANVGSIFEEPSSMLKVWTEEFLSTISRLNPKFVALHCQEVGGKNYEESMRHVKDFVRLLMSSEELRLFDKVRVFLDEDFSSAEHFTKLTENTSESQTSIKGSLSKLQFRNDSDDLILTLGKKEFSHREHQQVFVKNSGQWLREYDKELGDFEGRLFEFPIEFVPSYPYEENVKEGTKYMLTRVPAWCDRVLLSPAAKSLVKDISSPDAIEYGIIGPCTCMGDHKPVYLRVLLSADAGMINCCNEPSSSNLCFRVPESYLASERLQPLTPTTTTITTTTTSSFPATVAALLSLDIDSSTTSNPPKSSCKSCATQQQKQQQQQQQQQTSTSFHTSNNLLLAAPHKHDPYTPDSMDSPSPSALGIGLGLSSESVPPDFDAQPIAASSSPCAQQQHHPSVQRPKHQSAKHTMDRAVSPELLKSKLELIAEKRRDGEVDSNSGSEAGDDNADEHRREQLDGDVSWQRSHLLTRAWLQGKDSQVYCSFSTDLQHRSVEEDAEEGHRIHEASSETADRSESQQRRCPHHRNQQQQQCHLAVDMVIPRIAIINASNLESNASSVQLDDSANKRTATPSDQCYLDTCYSNTRTRSLSEADSSCGKSPAACSFEGNESQEETAEKPGILPDEGNEARQRTPTTRSNSIQSQEANVSLKLKAYNKVTERCKGKIVGEKGRCGKCCVVS